MAETAWYAFGEGATLGQKGSEGGIILCDDEHPYGARITLERDTRSAPFAITCGIYGCMMHTRFFSVAQRATIAYDKMKESLGALLEMPHDGTAESRKLFLDGISTFVERYP